MPSESGRVTVPGTSTKRRYIADIRTFQLARELAVGRDVLIVGCGAGHGVKLVAGAAKSCLAVEFDQKFLEHAARTYPAANIEWLLGGGNLLELAGRRFDLVVVPCLLEYVERPQRAAMMSQLINSTNPGGMVLVSANNRLYHDGKYSLYPTKGLASGEFTQLLTHAVTNAGRISYCGQRPPADDNYNLAQSTVEEGFRPDDDRIIALVEL